MQPIPAYFPSQQPFGQRLTLQQMFQSEERFADGLLSFRYPVIEASDEELDYFIGDVIGGISHAVSAVTKPFEGVAKTIGKAVSAVDKIVPVSMVTSALSATPLGMAVRAGIGAAQAVAEGKNVFQGAVRSLAPDVATRFFIDTGLAAARGENVMKAAEKAFQAGVGDVRKSLQFAAMVAPFVPGIGTGVAAALGAANALAAGQPITDALIAAARDALPGGAVAQFAFDTAMNMVKGKNVAESLLDAARSRVPGGPAVQAAFDAGLALAKGKNIQQALVAGAGRLMSASPFASDALSFVQKVAAGHNIQEAALSQAGNLVLKRMRSQAHRPAPVPAPPPRQIHLRIPPRQPAAHHELFEIGVPEPQALGRWVRRNGRLVVFAAYA
jgi:hypothetical protein